MKKNNIIAAFFLLWSGVLLAQDNEKFKLPDPYAEPEENNQERRNLEKIKHKKRNSIYGGFSAMPGTISGLIDVDISDIKDYGSFLEGRVSIPLSKSNTTDPLHFGVLIGYDYFFHDHVAISFSIRAGFNTNLLLLNVMLGPRAKLDIIPDLLEIGVSAKAGLSYFGSTFEEAETTTSLYVIVDNEFIIAPGDIIRSEILGFGLQGTVDLRFKLGTSGVFLFGEAGWLQSFFGQGPSSINLSISKGTYTYLSGDSRSISDERPRSIPVSSDYVLKKGGQESDYARNDDTMKNARFSMNGFIFSVGFGFEF